MTSGRPFPSRASACAVLALLFLCAGNAPAQEEKTEPDPALLGPGGDDAYVRNTDDPGVCANENECMGKYDAHGWEKLLPPVEGTYYEKFPSNLPIDKLSPNVQKALGSAGLERARCVYMDGECLAVCVPGKAGGDGGYCTSLEDKDRDQLKLSQDTLQAEMDKEAKALADAKRKAADEKAAQENKAGALNGHHEASKSMPGGEEFADDCDPNLGPLPKECSEEEKGDAKKDDILAMNEEDSKKRLLENDKQANDNTGGYAYDDKGSNPPASPGATAMSPGPGANPDGNVQASAVKINADNVDDFDASYRAAAANTDIYIKPYTDTVGYAKERFEANKKNPTTAWGHANRYKGVQTAAAVQAQGVTRKLDGTMDRTAHTANMAAAGAAEQAQGCTKKTAGQMGTINHSLILAGDCDRP